MKIPKMFQTLQTFFCFVLLYFLPVEINAQESFCSYKEEFLEQNNCPCEIVCPLLQNCIYLGPEVYHLTRTKEGGTKQKGYLYGLRGGYDRIKRYRLYWGIEGYFAKGQIRGKSGSDAKLVSDILDSEIEGRFGYTFHRKTCFQASFTPFIGYGYFYQTNHFKHPSPLHLHFRDTFQYLVGGFISKFYINPCWNVGITFKAKYSIDGKSKITHDPDFDDMTIQMSDKMQYSVDFPINGVFCWCNRMLDLSLVPFYQFRHYGGRENFPFDFIDTKFRIYGVRLLFNYCF